MGGVVLTAAYHVPRNRASEERGSSECWARYLREWVPANHVRAITCLGAAAFLLAATEL
ncbi:hypothetical protein [Saccharothrix australiensis]|uniref:hypothetical protein n=1 Tax=Saccharothrix australiensis TaxID=2072 RepID=UPI001FE9A141|nr:hypothetical protein [Saccharothrix australiensis]